MFNLEVSKLNKRMGVRSPTIMTQQVKPEDRLLRLLNHMSTLPLARAPFKAHNLTPAQFTLLGWVTKHPGCGVLDIAKGLDLTPPTVSVGVRRLARVGWLERRHDPCDRRARPLYLTPEGEKLVEKVISHRNQVLKLFLSGLTLDEQEQLLDLLERGVRAVKGGME
jgi:DNA-binding MarR family transcriptional regulator